jgi:hypothetical protein
VNSTTLFAPLFATQRLPFASNANAYDAAPDGSDSVTVGIGDPLAVISDVVYSTTVFELSFTTHILPWWSKATPLASMFPPCVTGNERATAGVGVPDAWSCAEVYAIAPLEMLDPTL